MKGGTKSKRTKSMRQRGLVLRGVPEGVLDQEVWIEMSHVLLLLRFFRKLSFYDFSASKESLRILFHVFH